MNLVDEALTKTGCLHPFFGGPQLSDVCSANYGGLFLNLFNAYIAAHFLIGDPCGRVRPVERADPSYDFIVVGGGAAGAVVAARLSEVPDWNVLLIEAGPDEPAGTQVPSNYNLFLDTELDWRYRTTNESFACLNHNGSCRWPRGKNLGGCTAHHGMAYHRGNRKDYEKWVAMGNVGWSWDEVLPYFLKSEDNREIGRVSAKYHATGGPMTVERFPYAPDFASSVMNAARETGYGVTEDFVADNITGFTITQTMSKNGVRQSSAAAFLRPIRNRPNFKILLNAIVTKITTVESRATGVEYVQDGKTYRITATREVVIAGGAINSPLLLLQSGIGPADHLKSVGVPVVHNSPGVGGNLHNHVSFGMDFTLDTPAKSEFNAKNEELYLYNQTGPLSSTGLAQVSGVLASRFTTPDDPDIQIFFAGYQATCQSKNEIVDLQSYDDKTTVRFTSVNLHALSRGRISLKSKDPLETPVIWSNELADPRDVSVLIEGIHAILKLAKSTALQKHGIKLASPRVEKCSQFEEGSDEYWRCSIHWNTRPENHQAGTCKMGPSSDPMAVVDPRLKVHGVQGLRVADASIMPRVISGNPHAVCNMIGERVADFIKEDYGVKTR